MARFKFQGVTVDQAGNLILSATVSAFLTGVSTVASIYTASSGGSAVNSVTSSSTNGLFEFWVDTDDYTIDQRFKIIISKTDFTSVPVDEITIFPYMIVPIENDAVTPTVTIGNAGDGLYSPSNNIIRMAINGLDIMQFDTSGLQATATSPAPTMINETSSITNPVFVFDNDSSSGLGRAAANSPAVIGGGVTLQAWGTETLTAAAPTLRHWGATILDSNLNAVDGTLGSGTYIGQIKTIVMTEASNSSTISITNHQTSDPEVATFNAVDETGVFLWSGTEWITLFATCTFV